MLKLKFKQGDWVVVCDGARALFLENAGDERFPNLRTVEAREEPHASEHEPHGEGPGRVYESVGAARSAVETPNPKDRAETRFLEQVARDLEIAAKAGRMRTLHVVAPARALGVLRRAYGEATRRILGEEIAKDYAHAPVHEIERILTGGAPGTR